MNGIFSTNLFQQLLFVTIGAGILALVVALAFRVIIGKKSPSNDVVQALAAKIRLYSLQAGQSVGIGNTNFFPANTGDTLS